MSKFLSVKAHTTRFFDRPVAKSLDKTLRKFLSISGGATRKTAQRSLRRARQKRLSELTGPERKKFEAETLRFKQGRRPDKPKRPEITAPAGKPPVLHMKPSSPLRTLLLYSLDDTGRSVVVGPARNGDNGDLERLEARHPFMEPALVAVTPRIPDYLARVARTA